MEQYPEHEKLKGVSELSQQLGRFLDWALNQGGYILSQYNDRDCLYPVHKNVNQLLSEFYNIDLVKLESEKLQMIEEMRKLNSK